MEAIVMKNYTLSSYLLEELCEEDQQQVLKSWEYQPYDNLFDHMVWSHGLLAYADTCDLYDALRNLDILEDFANSAEICCADKSQRLGPIGVYLRGSCKVVSNSDLSSYKIKKSCTCRVWDSEKALPFKGIVDNTKDIIYRKEEYKREPYSHCEVILYDYVLLGIWVKEEYIRDLSTEDKKELETLLKAAKDRGLVVHIVHMEPREYD